MDQNTGRILDAFSDRIMSQIHKPFDSIYVECDTLHDFRIGAVLSLIRTQSEFEYVQHKLKAYDLDVDKSIEKHFPALKFRDEFIDRIVCDPTYAKKILIASPPSNYYGLLQQVLQNLTKHAEMFGNTPAFHITFNSSKVCYPNQFQMMLAKPFHQFRNVDFSIDFNTDKLYNRDAEFLHSYDVFLIEDIRDLVKPDTPMIKAFTGEDIIHKEMFAPRKYDSNLIKPEDEDFQQVMEATEKWLGLAVNFQFVEKRICEFAKGAE